MYIILHIFNVYLYSFEIRLVYKKETLWSNSLLLILRILMI